MDVDNREDTSDVSDDMVSIVDDNADDDDLMHIINTSSILPPRLKHGITCMMEEIGQNYKRTISPEEMDLYSKIMTAIRNGHISVLQYIHTIFPEFKFNFRYNLNPAESKKPRIISPFLYACECGQTQIVKYLIELMAGFGFTDKTKSEETALILAVSHTNVDLDLVQTLLKLRYQNLGARKKFKKTALHIACTNGLVEVVKLLLDYNNSWAAKGKLPPKIIAKAPDLQDKHGNTPFMLAIQKDTENHRRIVRLWLEMELNPAMAIKDPICEISNSKGFYPAMVAAQTGQLECLKIMAEFNSISDNACSQITKNGWNILHCAVASGNLDLLQWLLNEKPRVEEIIDEPNMKGYTPFLMACEYHHLAVIEFFLTYPSSKIDFLRKTKDGLTCLHIAALHDASEVLDLLLSHSGPPTSLDLLVQETKYGDTILHTALRRSSLNVEYRLSQEPEFERLKSMKNVKEETPEDVRSPAHIPYTIRKRGAESVRAYLKALREGNTKNSHCNLVVLGEERVGKTSLIKGVLGMEFDPNCQPTQGVQLKEIETVAECFDIKLHDQEETWEAIDSPLDRIKEEYINSVAKAITEATNTITDIDQPPQMPIHPNTSSSSLEKELLFEVDRLIKVVRPQLAAANANKEEEKKTSADVKPVSKRPQTLLERLLRLSRREEKRIVDLPTSFELAQVQLPKLQKPVSHDESKAIVKKIKKKKTPSEESIIFHTIDFAGQSLYRPMHHCFITHRAVYIVVFKLTDLLKHIRQETLPRNPINEIRYWLNNIIAHASLANDHDDPPKIFLVGTHKNGEAAPTTEHANDGQQRNKQPPLTDQELEEINDELMSTFVTCDDKKYRYTIQYTKKEGGNIVFAIENSLTPKHNERRRESGISLFMQRINEIKVKIPFLKLKFPTSYIKFEEKILEMQKERKNEPLMTTKKEVKEWAVECGINDQEADINAVMGFYHDIRVIVVQDLISSPFRRPPRSSESENDLVILSPQWLGDMMCKIMQLKIGNENFDTDTTILLNTAGIICKKNLEKCLLGKPCTTETEHKSFNNLLNILQSYCLIYELSKHLGELLRVEMGNDLYYLVPSKMPPQSKSKPLSRDSYNFEFDFNSYLPHEVYIHCVCMILSKFNKLQSDRNRSPEMSHTCSTFYHIRLEDSLPFVDLSISFHEQVHTLVFTICPYDKSRQDLFRYIVEVDELIVSPVSRAGSLGRLSYKGGPRTKCSCVHDDQTVILPLVRFTPDQNIPSPDTPTCDCECGHKQYNVDEIMRLQIQPAQLLTGPVIQNINIKIENDSNTTANTVPGRSVPQPQQQHSNHTSEAEEFHKEDTDYCEVFKDHYDSLVKAMATSCSLLSNIARSLRSVKLVSQDNVDDEALTATRPQQIKQSVINLLNEVRNFLDIAKKRPNKQKKILMDFCRVLQTQDSPMLQFISTEILETLGVES